MENILFYAPFDGRSRDNETVMLGLKEKGYNVFFLTQLDGSTVVEFLNQHGIHAFAKPTRSRFQFINLINQLFYFLIFCKKHKINIVFSHLEPANFIAAIGQYLIKAKVYLVRHHINEARLYGFDKSLSYKITYKLAKKIIVVSEHAKRYMVKNEGIPERKIQHINLAYDFSLYNKVNKEISEKLRLSLDTEIILISICRFTKYKRPDTSILTLKRLIDSGYRAKLILLGKGELETSLQELLIKNNLKNQVIMPGHVLNVLDYLAAADFVLHPSLLDSSSVVIKEAGLLKKPVIVCQGIGDFDDYIKHEENGLIADQTNFIEDSCKYIIKYKDLNSKKEQLGEMLYNTIYDLFDVKKILPQYIQLLEKK